MKCKIWAKRFAASLISFLLILCILISVILAAAFDEGFYIKQYKRLGISESTGIKHDVLIRITTELLDYIKGTGQELDTIKAEVDGVERQVFNDKEITHMVDVRNLFDFAIALRDISILILLLITLALILCYKNKALLLKLLANAYIFFIKVTVAIVLILTIISFINFTWVWDFFHIIFFNNDLWLLDPETDIMVVMLPEELFSAIVSKVVLQTAAIAGILYIAAKVLVRRDKKPVLKRNEGVIDELLQKNE